jgi:hypothetical protein
VADFSFDENVSEDTAHALSELGHDVLTTRQAGNKGLDDVRQLTLAVRLGRIFVTYNRRDFLLLHRAWRLWSHEWGVSGHARHNRILILVQPPRLAPDRAAFLLDRFVADQGAIANHVFAWQPAGEWTAEG